MKIQSAQIIGSGLIGTSIGLALSQRGVAVSMVDSDKRAQAIAQQLVGKPSEGPFDIGIIATPPSAFSSIISELDATSFNFGFIDVLSIKAKPLKEIEESKVPRESFLPTHPMAGREIGGAESARADLFEGRAWVIDSSGSDPRLVEVASDLITELGASIVDIAASDHDRAVAIISHFPQLVASLTAKQLVGVEQSWLDLAGAGLRDTTRIAASDSALWREIIIGNSQAIKPLLQALQSDLTHLIESIDDPSVVAQLIDAGNRGRAGISGKHGGRAREYSYLPIVIDDKPGQLAAIFDECANAQVNVEDLTIEHSPGQQTGLITIAVPKEDSAKLVAHLSDRGWNVHSPRA